MNGEDVLFHKMMKEAVNELASGDRSWKDCPTNTLIMACFGMLLGYLGKKLERPLWLFATSVLSGVIWFVVRTVFLEFR